MTSKTDTQGLKNDYRNWMNDAVAYGTDFFQRSIIYMDILRQRGNNYLEHNKKGMPPVLSFDHEIIQDGRDHDPGANYMLARIHDRRTKALTADDFMEKRRFNNAAYVESSEKRPVIILDPRAGGGPGIGGSKQDSEIGMALHQGHPVYFILFSPDPLPGQTMSDVQQVMAWFVETVRGLHTHARKPIIIGNCQAGWAIAMLGTLHPENVGPIILNGAPLSFWAGVAGKNPMRYRAGWTGGVWLASLWSDLGNGMFDGANLLAGFEDLNLSRTLWDKQYYLWANLDTEEERYLEFEKWWNGYFKLTGDEFHFIVDELFVGNRLEKGLVKMHGQKIDLKKLQGPVLVFASRGDNITPPQQALNWIPKVWGTVDEIRREKRVIVYMVHDTIGHLGIFVSRPVSRKEHKEMIASIDQVDLLAPGLYEMIISETDDHDTHQVRFEKRDMADVYSLDDKENDDVYFASVAALSTRNDVFYRTLIRPFVRAMVTETVAEGIRQLHPLRVSKYMFSDLNPWILPFKTLAESIRKDRSPVAEDNLFSHLEKTFSKSISASLNLYRDVRDLSQELWFQSVYGNPWVKSWFNERIVQKPESSDTCKPEWLQDVSSGGYAEAVVRMMNALAHAGSATDRRILKAYEEISEKDKRLIRLVSDRLTETVKKQACILVSDPDRAIAALATLLPDQEDRQTAFDIATGILSKDEARKPEVQSRIQAIRGVLGIEGPEGDTRGIRGLEGS